MANDWMDRDTLRAPEPQIVTTHEVIAYLADRETLTTIWATAVNDELTDLDLNGRKPADFDSLRDDVYHGLYGKRISIDGYFKTN